MDREAVIKTGLKTTIVILILLLFIPLFVYAGSNDEEDLNKPVHVTSKCVYKRKSGDTDYIIFLTFRGLTNAGAISVDGGLDIYNFKVENGTPYSIYRTSIDSSYDDIVFNVYKDYGIYFALSNHVTNVFGDNDSEKQPKRLQMTGSFVQVLYMKFTIKLIKLTNMFYVMEKPKFGREL